MAAGRRPARVILLGFVVILYVGIVNRRSQVLASGDTRDQCALFTATPLYTHKNGESYIEIAPQHVDSSFSLELDILPDMKQHDGILFAVGTKDFKYYEWRTKAVHMVYLVVEFYFGALSLLLKAKGTEYMKQITVHTTWPKPYRINDGQWHHVKVSRNNEIWSLEIDDILQEEEIHKGTDVQLDPHPAYMGGRPGYTHNIFKGVITRVFLNGQAIPLDQYYGKVGMADVWHCSYPAVHNFIGTQRNQLEKSRRPRKNNSKYRKLTTTPTYEDMMDL